jgi:hypothetical protein
MVRIVSSFLICFYLSAQANTTGGNVVCTQQYALCSSAKCVPVPGMKAKSVCRCLVESGPSLGSLSCKARKPRKVQNDLTLLYSSFSFLNKPNQMLHCPSGKPWTFCLDKPCYISPHDPSKAVCTCDIKYTKDFYTEGGDCNTNACDNQLWSAATQGDLINGTKDLIEALNLRQSPIIFCPSKDI